MSVVTSFLLICSPAEEFNWSEKPPGNLATINAWLKARNFDTLFDCAGSHGNPKGTSAGNKYPQFHVYMAGFNHFPEDEFIAFFRTVEWEEPENVVLIMDPDQGTTRVFRPPHEVWGPFVEGDPAPGQTECL